eukprot:8786834-Alexandrium_andersonii.AAC.1
MSRPSSSDHRAAPINPDQANIARPSPSDHHAACTKHPTSRSGVHQTEFIKRLSSGPPRAAMKGPRIDSHRATAVRP